MPTPKTPANAIRLARCLFLKWRHRPLRSVGLFVAERNTQFVVKEHADLHFGTGVNFQAGCYVYLNGRVTLGDRVFFNRNSHLLCHDAVTIGNDAIFGEMVSIHDADHVIDQDRGLAPDLRGYATAPIVIGDKVWVGAKATILRGVTIGANTIIGANSVVTRDIPANVVAAGIPARVIRELAAS
jgi:maltose O-acetyltransferase